MSDYYLGEVRVFGFNFAPQGWAMCNGTILPISQNTALFSLLGTNYGGDGITTFALPNLQAAAGMHWGSAAGLSNYSVGESGGTAQVTLQTNAMPVHGHGLQAFEGRGRPAHNAPSAGDALTTAANNAEAYLPPPSPSSGYVSMNPAELTIAGSGNAHNNRMPSLVLNYCIALQGIYPSRS